MKANDIETANKQYEEYLTNHIGNVKRGFKWLVDNNIVKDDSHKLFNQLEKHDESKYDQVEWGPYRDYFYIDGSEKTFNYAWLHHIHHNPHHWQYWLLVSDDNDANSDNKINALRMPKNYIVEMICDWWAFSWAKGDLLEIFKWYDENKNNIIMHPETVKDVESLLAIIKRNINETNRYLTK